jgi:glucose repression mediator protein
MESNNNQPKNISQTQSSQPNNQPPNAGLPHGMIPGSIPPNFMTLQVTGHYGDVSSNQHQNTVASIPLGQIPTTLGPLPENAGHPSGISSSSQPQQSAYPPPMFMGQVSRNLGVTGPQPGQNPYAAVEMSQPMLISSDQGQPRLVFAQPGSGPQPNATAGIPQGPSIMQILGNNSYPKNGPLNSIDPNGMFPNQDQMLFQGPIILNQYNSIAEYLAGKGDFPNAIKYYEKITSLDPENGAAWAALGHCYLLTDDLQRAFTSYQKALYSLPDVRDPQLWYGIGLLYDKVELVITFDNSLKLMSMLFPHLCQYLS